MKTVKRLTQESVKNEKSPGEHPDGQYGLRLRVGKTGEKSWRVKAKQRGASTITVTLGKFPALTLNQAREAAREKYNQLRRGENPNEMFRLTLAKAAEEKRQAQAKTAADAWTLAAALEAYCTTYEGKRSETTIANYKQYLKTHLNNWAETPLTKLTEEDVLHRHKELRETATNVTANQAMSVLSSLYTFSMKHPASLQFVASNPVKVLRRMEQIKPAEPRTRIISEAELPGWFSNIRKFEAPMRDVLVFMLLTGVRGGAATTLEWRNVDLEARSFSIENKGHIRNGGKRLVLPITDYVLTLLKQRKENAVNQYVFNAVNTPHVYFQYQKWHRRLKEFGIARFSPHALRHTYTTAAAEVCPEAVRKRLLGHGGKSDVTQHHYTHIPVERLLPWAQEVENAILQMAKLKPKPESKRRRKHEFATVEQLH